MLNKMCLLGEGFCIVEALIRRSFHVNIYLCTKAENLSPGQPKYLSRCGFFGATTFVYHRGWSTHINCGCIQPSLCEMCWQITQVLDSA